MRLRCSRTWQSNQAWAQQPASWRLACPFRLLKHLLGRPPFNREWCGCTVAVCNTLSTWGFGSCQQQSICLGPVLAWTVPAAASAVASLHQLMSVCHACSRQSASVTRHSATMLQATRQHPMHTPRYLWQRGRRYDRGPAGFGSSERHVSLQRCTLSIHATQHVTSHVHVLLDHRRQQVF